MLEKKKKKQPSDIYRTNVNFCRLFYLADGIEIKT